MEAIYVIAIIGILLYVLYSRLIKRRNRALEALSGIDVQIKKRANLIPNVLAIAKKFMEHERALLEDLTAARTAFEKSYDAGSAADVQDHLKAAEGVQSTLGRLIAIAENYPDLKSDTVMQKAQKTYQDVEANIAAARRFYNSAVTDLNNATQIFPSSLVASMIKIGEMPFYEIDDATPKGAIPAADHLGG
ncbi:MAG: LemA family protein [Alphaproteobacteria bacterium]